MSTDGFSMMICDCHSNLTGNHIDVSLLSADNSSMPAYGAAVGGGTDIIAVMWVMFLAESIFCC